MQVPHAVVKNSFFSRYSFTKAYYDMGTVLEYDVMRNTYLKMCDIDDGLDTDVHDLSGTYLELNKPKDELDDDQCHASLKSRVTEHKRKRSVFRKNKKIK
jgi:hypothetical protein